MGAIKTWIHKLGRSLRGKDTPQLVFRRFLDVLEHNNRALEIIADLGEKGSGDYIFDHHYIEQSLDDLHATVTASARALNTLCRHRFPDLEPRLEELRREARRALRGGDPLEGPLVRGLDDLRPGDWDLTGGKAGHLVELRRDPRVLVPPGFVITVPAFFRLMRHAGLSERYEAFAAAIARGAEEAAVEAERAALERGVLEAEPPPELQAAVSAGLEDLAAGEALLAVRSSAVEEDQEFSYAGQFHSELGVAPRPGAVLAAYRRVAASLFSRSALHYHRHVMPGEGELAIAACCQVMVRAQVSGVAYTVDPAEPLAETMLVVGAWGYGAAVVEGAIAADSFVLGKSEPFRVVRRDIGRKEKALEYGETGEEWRRPAPGRRTAPCLSDARLRRLAACLVHLENRYRRPLDVEWSFDRDGRLFILQARPLRVAVSSRERRSLAARLQGYQLLAEGRGKIAQQGIGCGPVFKVDTGRDLESFPDNAVLVARRDSSRFVKVMERAAAILTETGTPVSHMATLCREMQVPCIVGVENITRRVAPGEEITVDADEHRIYRGRVVELLSFRADSGRQLVTGREFRVLRKVLRKVSRLNLVDPLLDNFSVEGCASYHDALRFIHENAVRELIELGRDEGRLLRRNLARHLDLPVPVGIIVIDIGGGIASSAAGRRVGYADILSEPFRAVLEGMLFPGVWHRNTMQVGVRDLMSSMFSAPVRAVAGRYTGHNIAIIGANYVNLCFRLGYHFNIIDAYCSDNERDNHIYYRFLGGASEFGKRARRARMIEHILREFDFKIKVRGDLVIARHGGLTRPDMKHVLDIIGRLVGFTRQLDVRLESDAVADYFAEAFLRGEYEVVGKE